MLVVDASALVEVLTVDPDGIPELSRRLHSAEWMSAPELIDYEVLNVLRKLVLRGIIDGDFADTCRRRLGLLRVSRYSMSEEMSSRVWQLRDNASAYDASYLALAETLRVPLITTERRLAQGLAEFSSVPIESYAL